MSWQPITESLTESERRREAWFEAEQRRRLQEIALVGPAPVAVASRTHEFSPEVQVRSEWSEHLYAGCSCGWRSQRRSYTQTAARARWRRHARFYP